MSTLDEFSDGFPKQESLYDPHLNAKYNTNKKKLNDARRRVIEENELTRDEKSVLYRFDRELRNMNNRKDRHQKNTRALHVDLTRRLEKRSGLLIDILDETHDGKVALDDLLAWVQNQGFSGNYIHNLLITVQTFGEILGSEIVQERVDDINPGRFRSDGDPPLPGDVLSWSDSIEMAMTRAHFRDQAMILSQWGLGARPDSEFIELQYKHLEWQDGHYQVTIPSDGKTGPRTIRLFPGAAGLRRWIEEEHPVHADPEAELGPETYLWTKLNKNERMEYNNLYRIFNEAGEASDVSKNTAPQHFRRSRASFFAGKPSISELELRIQFGWSHSSSSPRHYITRFREDTDQNVAVADGADVDLLQDKINVTPIECDNCQRWTERHVTNCVCCGAEVEEERHTVPTTATVAADETDLLAMILDGDVDADDLRSVKKLWGVIKSRPRLGEELDDLIKKTERMVDDEKSNAYGGVGACASMAAGGLMAAGQRAAAAWGRAKDKGMRMHPDFEHYPGMSRARKVGLAGALGLLFTPLFISWYMDGTFAELAAGDATAWIPVLIGLVFAGWLFDRELPDEADALEAME